VRYGANFARKRQRWGEAMREHEAILDALRRRAGVRGCATNRRRTARRRSALARRASPRAPARGSIAARSRRDGSAPRYDAGEVPLRVLVRRRPPKPGVTVSDHRALQ